MTIEAVLTTTLAYRPFLDPLNLHDRWYLLLVPMSILISMTYKAVRLEDLRRLPRQTLAMSLQVILGMMALGFVVYMTIEYVLPVIAPRPS